MTVQTDDGESVHTHSSATSEVTCKCTIFIDFQMYTTVNAETFVTTTSL